MIPAAGLHFCPYAETIEQIVTRSVERPHGTLLQRPLKPQDTKECLFNQDIHGASAKKIQTETNGLS
jgi:hypothetical protein